MNAIQDNLGYYKSEPGDWEYVGRTRARTKNHLPCGAQVTQTMSIDCPSGNVTFEMHQNSFTISDTTIDVSRNGTAPPDPEVWGQSAGDWIATHPNPSGQIFEQILHLLGVH